jgi:hypothetical protein
VIDDDAANRHWFTLSTPGLWSLLSGSHALTGRLRGLGLQGSIEWGDTSP